MTPEQLAARVLANVPKYTAHHVASTIGHPDPVWLHETEALAALARLFAPGDGLVERGEKVRDWLANGGHLDMDASGRPSETVTALLARISALTATVGDLQAGAEFLTKNRNEWQDACTVARNEAATLRNRLARMEGALKQRDVLITELCTSVDCAAEDIGGQRSALLIIRELAALTDGDKHE